MELGGENIRDTKTRWEAKIQRAGKWGFYSIAYEDIMTCVYNEENQNFGRVQTETLVHTTIPVPKNYRTKIPTCMICSMEEGVMRRAKAFENQEGRHYSRRKAHL